jgi:Ca2+-binding EF-hand superfamily protein
VIRSTSLFDPNGDGKVSFEELGNFLLKRHCRELSLQKYHREKQLKTCDPSLDLKLKYDEFRKVVNDAFAFLGKIVPESILLYLFKKTDKDCDRYITYAEYFTVTYDAFCQPTTLCPIPKPTPVPYRRLKIHIHIWSSLQRVYDKHIKGQHVPVTWTALKSLVFSITGQLSEWESSYFFTQMWKLDIKYFEFNRFASHFLYCLSKLGLLRRYGLRENINHTISQSEFISILTDTFSFANLDSYKDTLLPRIYKLITVKGQLTYAKYLYGWVEKYVCSWEVTYDEYYIEEDDDEKINECPSPRPAPIPDCRNNIFNFTDYEYSKQVRARVYQLLSAYDHGIRGIFSECDIKRALQGLLNCTVGEINDVTRNVFLYDINNDGKVTIDEFTNYCVEQHFGWLILQRWHREKRFCRWAYHQLSEQDFISIMTEWTDKIGLKAKYSDLRRLFNEIDLDDDGLITYNIYSTFLEEYFGTHCKVKPDEKDPKEDNRCRDEEEEYWEKYKCLTPKERFCKSVTDQTKAVFLKYDDNKNGVFERDEIRQIILCVFKLDYSESSRLINKSFSSLCSSWTFEQMLNAFIKYFILKFADKRLVKLLGGPGYMIPDLTEAEFVEILLSSLQFIPFKPRVSDLRLIFKVLVGNRSSLSHNDFVQFLLSCFKCPEPPKPEPQPDFKEKCLKSKYVRRFHEECWKEMRGIFGTLKRCN